MKKLDRFFIGAFIAIAILALCVTALSVSNTRKQIILDQKSELIKRDAERHAAWLAQWRR